jgi:predicted hotdog family 3-hydroxylacyl-ACP dehydratase
VGLPDIRNLLPHAGPMVLLDRLISADAESVCAEVCIRQDSMFYKDGAVGAWIGLEYMAQAIAAFAGYNALVRGEPVKIGFVLGTRHYDCIRPLFLPGKVLKVSATRVFQDDSGMASFDCYINDESGPVASAGVTVFQPADAGEFLDRSLGE